MSTKRHDIELLRDTSHDLQVAADNFASAMQRIAARRAGGAFDSVGDATWEFGARWSKVTEEYSESLMKLGAALEATAAQLQEHDDQYAAALSGE